MICDNCLIKSICKNGCEELLNYINLNKLVIEDFSNHNNLSYRLMSLPTLHTITISLNLDKKITIEVNNLQTRWNKNGQYHRDDGPAIEYADGTKEWYKKGRLHREGGPAIELANGDKRWCKNGKYHREDGPAIELTNGRKEWYKKGRLHREGGPAIEYYNGIKEWWLNGKNIRGVIINDLR